jgi:hypothetical protein
MIRYYPACRFERSWHFFPNLCMVALELVLVDNFRMLGVIYPFIFKAFRSEIYYTSRGVKWCINGFKERRKGAKCKILIINSVLLFQDRKASRSQMH